MDGTDELLTIAEVAIGLAGFAGIVAVFQYQGGFTAVQRLRFLAIFAASFSAILLAFLPLVIYRLNVSDAEVWRWSSVGALILWTPGAVLAPFGIRRIKRETAYSYIAAVVLYVPALGNGGLLLSNATGWIWEPGFVAYFLGLLTWLYTAALIFVFAVLFPPITEDA
jgi:hypothetical protein